MKNKFLERARSLKQLNRAIALVWSSGPRWMLSSVALVLLQAILPLLSLFLLKSIVDTATQGLAAPLGSVARHAAWTNTLTWIFFAAVVALASSLASTVSSYVTEGQSLAMRHYMGRLVQRKSVSMDLEYFENAEFFNTLHRAQEEAPFRPTRIVNGLTQLAQNIISLVALVGLLLTLHVIVPFVLFLSVIPALLVRFRFVSVLYDWTQRSTSLERTAQYFNYILTLGPFAKEVRLFDMGPFFEHRFDWIRSWLTQGRLQVARRRLRADLGVQFFVVLPAFGLLAFTALRTFEGYITLGGLVMYFQAIQRGQSAMQGALGSFLSLHEDTTFLTLLYRFLDLEPRLKVSTAPHAVPKPFCNGISIKNVSFSYPLSKRAVLKNVSLDIAPGEVVALVGENGSGKTTLVKLLCRLYDPTEGQITMDGTDLREFNPSDFRSQISVVFQDYNQYALTLNENIWLGNLSLPAEGISGAISTPAPETRQAILEAAQRSGADQVAAQLPEGYDTLLGRQFEGGEELSIGQWQKIALSRAFLRQSQLIILDEPTSALDPRAEAEVFDKFRDLIQGQAALLISHRLSTVRMADRICVLDKGCIVAVGTHDELMERGDLYAELFQTQAQAYR